VAGFRIDVCNVIIKDAELRDNPAATEEDPLLARLFGQRWLYSSNRPEVHDVLRRWRKLADGYDPPRLLLGETNVEDLGVLASYYGDGRDELHLGFNFPFINAPFDAVALRALVEAMEARLPSGAWPVWTGSNHDVSRLASRWAGGDPAKVRLAVMMLLTLRGTAVLYQGDEIGLVDTVLSREDVHDPVGVRFWPAYPGRDPARTPMPWRNQEGGGFTSPGATPWLPLGDVTACTVAEQQHDPGSILALTRDLIALRRATTDLQLGDYTTLPAPDGVWAWRRGAATAVALNFSDQDATVDVLGPAGKGRHARIAIGTDRARDGEAVTDGLRIGPWEGVVLSF
jgi:alpha-glucosidase